MKPEITPYNYTQINDKFLLVNKAGYWTSLSKETFDDVKNDKYEEGTELFDFLKKSNFFFDDKLYDLKTKIPAKKYGFLTRGPSLHIIVLTNLCNLNCVYCQASSLKNSADVCSMTAETAKKVVDFIFQSKTEHITIEFQGGEPLLNFDVMQFIIEYAKNLNLEHKKDIKFAFTTNFQFLNDDKLDYLAFNKVGLCVSLDGPKELHDSQRVSAGKSNHDYVSYWLGRIKELKNNGKISKSNNVNALVTVTKDSLKHPEKIIDEYVKFGLDVIHLRNLNKIGAAEQSWDKIGYSCEEFVQFWKKAVDYIIELNKKGIFFRERLVFLILQKLLQHFEPNYTELRSPCGACISQVVYSPDGNIYSCDEGRMLKDDIFRVGCVEQKQSEVITCEKSLGIILSSINDLQKCDDCVWQPYCGLCPVLNYAEFGSLIADPEKTTRCKIFKEQFKYIFEKILFDEEAKKVLMSWVNAVKA